MVNVEPFDELTQEYDSWFEKNHFVYLSELQAVREQFPAPGSGIEIGVGTGRFAAPLGIDFGIEPSHNMCLIARGRGVMAVRGAGEALPFKDAEFDTALMVTTLCFLEDVPRAFAETYRILKPGGCLIVGFVDKDSFLGRFYEQHKDESPFYRIATFYGVEEVRRLLKQTGYRDLAFKQTIFKELSSINEIEPVQEGHGLGSFVVAKGIK